MRLSTRDLPRHYHKIVSKQPILPSRASFDPATRPLTQLEFHNIRANVPGWPGSDQSAHDDVTANVPSLPEPSPDNPCHIERVINQYKQVKHAEFYKKLIVKSH